MTGYLFDLVLTIELPREARSRSEAAELLRSMVGDECIFVLGDGERHGRVAHGKARLAQVAVHLPPVDEPQPVTSITMRLIVEIAFWALLWFVVYRVALAALRHWGRLS